MKQLELLERFLNAAAEDPFIHPAHISLYVTLLYYWKRQDFINPVDVRRDKLMKQAKITGRTTYQRCLRELRERGYILYEPKYNRFVNSCIYLKEIK